MPAVPHDPAHRARLSYTWRDEHWHLIDTPEPTVVLVSASVSKGDPYPTLEQAEDAFWTSVVGSVLAHTPRLVSTAWADVEAAVLADPSSRMFHLCVRDGRATGARPFSLESEARASWADAVQVLLGDRFPDWTIWHSPAGYWRGTHKRELTEEQADRESPFQRTVEADTPEELAPALAQQEMLREGTKV